jgi:dTDP-4-amino-4,6-dideoxygalactose transaminase
MPNTNPYTIIADFEERLSDFCGSKYAVCVESGTAALFLCLAYRKTQMGSIGDVIIPNLTYPSAACSIIHNGGKVVFDYNKWEGEYELSPLKIWDSALRFKKGMFEQKGNVSGLQCLSFHVKKLIPIGRGGCILTDDKEAHEWFKLARFDGREPVPLQQQKEFTVLGYNFYMEPANAARGIQLMEAMRQKYPDGMEDLVMEEQGYSDLSKFPIYTQ